MKEIINKINNCNICNNLGNKIELKSGTFNTIFVSDVIENHEKQIEYIDLLNLLYKSLDLKSENIYFTSICKCYNAGIKNIDNCITNLKSEIIAIQPKCIILLGEKVISRLLNISDPIENIHGKVITNKNIKYILSYSLEDVLLNEKAKIEFWKDIKENFNE